MFFLHVITLFLIQNLLLFARTTKIILVCSMFPFCKLYPHCFFLLVIFECICIILHTLTWLEWISCCLMNKCSNCTVCSSLYVQHLQKNCSLLCVLSYFRFVSSEVLKTSVIINKILRKDIACTIQTAML